MHNDELLIASETVAPGQAIQYLYDDDDLPIFVTAQGQDLALAYDPDHGLLETTAYGQVTTAQDYTGFGELDFFEAVHGGSTLLFREDVVLRDKLGRILEVDITIGGTTTRHSYTYDSVGRLDTVTVGGMLVADHAYDANGNRTAPSPGGPVQIDDQDRLLQLDGATYTYTDNGELLTRTDASGQATYTYDGLGNLTRVVLPDGTVIEYVIDGRSRRIGKKVCPAPCGGGTPTLVKGFLYRDGLNPVAELDGSGQLVSQFVYASKTNVPDLMIRGGVVYRILSDHLGSVRLVVNASTGAIAQQIDYDAWGNPAFVTGPADFQPFGFSGGLYDPDTALVRFGARDYDAITGRWTTKDPLAFNAGDPNLYLYAFSDPINLNDPSGEVNPLVVAVGVVAVAIAAKCTIANASAIADKGKSIRDRKDEEPERVSDPDRDASCDEQAEAEKLSNDTRDFLGDLQDMASDSMLQGSPSGIGGTIVDAIRSCF